MRPKALSGSIAKYSRGLALSALTLIGVPSAQADVYYWDDDAATLGFGTAGASAGTWEAPTAGTIAGWSLSATGADAFAAFITGIGDTLNFGNGTTGLAAGTITVNGTVVAGNIIFASGSGVIALSGGTINLAAASTITVDNASNTISSILAGTSLTKAGPGVLILSGTNTYTGLTTVSAGTLEVTANDALGTIAAGTSVTAGATLKLTNVNYSTAEGLTINGAGAGGAGDGALVSSGTSTFAGLITAVTNATINAGNGTLALSGVIVKDGTTLTLTFKGAGGTITISGTGISGASAFSDLVVDGTTVIKDVASTYNGPTTITNGGTLIANALGALPLSPRSAVSFTGTGTSALNLGANQFVASLSSAGAATVALGSNTLTVGIAGGPDTTFAGSITGTGGNLIKDTNSKQVLSGSNGYTGTTTVSAGTLEVTGSLSGTTAVTVTTGGTLLLNGATSNIVGNGNMTPGSGTTITGNTTGTGPNAGASFTSGGVSGNGGTLAVQAGATGLTHSFNEMTLNQNTTLDFSSGTGNVNLIFASLNGATKTALTGTPTLTLTIANWSGPQYSPGDTVDSSPTGFGDGRDRLIFTSDPGFGLGSFIAGINFTGFGAGATQVAFGSGFEIVPVPEPATTALIGSIALCALIGYRERRRFTGLGKRTTARK